VTAGRTISQSELNNTWGGLATSLFNVLSNIQHAKAVLDGFSSANLVAMGFVQADADLLKSAAADMGDLANVFNGLASTHVTGAYDYKSFSKQLLGTGLY
jgi:hypothetical protein